MRIKAVILKLLTSKTSAAKQFEQTASEYLVEPESESGTSPPVTQFMRAEPTDTDHNGMVGPMICVVDEDDLTLLKEAMKRACAGGDGNLLHNLAA